MNLQPDTHRTTSKKSRLVAFAAILLLSQIGAVSANNEQGLDTLELSKRYRSCVLHHWKIEGGEYLRGVVLNSNKKSFLPPHGFVAETIAMWVVTTPRCTKELEAFSNAAFHYYLSQVPQAELPLKREQEKAVITEAINKKIVGELASDPATRFGH